MKTTILLTALILATSAQARLHTERRQTFNASILNFDAYRYAVDLDNTRHGTYAFGYRVGDRLKLRGSRLDYNGHVTVYQITRDVLHVRYDRPRSQRAEESLRLTIQRIGR